MEQKIWDEFLLRRVESDINYLYLLNPGLNDIACIWGLLRFNFICI